MYLGCALCFATASIHLDDLITASVGELASLIKEAIKRLKQDHIRSSLSTLESYRLQHGASAMEEICLRHPEHGIIVTNLTRMPIEDLDFGTGSPQHLTTYNEVLRGAALLPAEGGVEIVVEYPAGST